MLDFLSLTSSSSLLHMLYVPLYKVQAFHPSSYYIIRQSIWIGSISHTPNAPYLSHAKHAIFLKLMEDTTRVKQRFRIGTFPSWYNTTYTNSLFVWIKKLLLAVYLIYRNHFMSIIKLICLFLSSLEVLTWRIHC